MHLVLAFYFSLFDIPQNTDAFDTFADFFRVYPAVFGAECLHDGVVAADFRPPGPLQQSNMFF